VSDLSRTPDARHERREVNIEAVEWKSPKRLISVRRATAAVAYDRVVAYDEQLAARIREFVAAEAGVTEQKMFGGLAFLIGGNMAVAASGQGGILVRVDPEKTEPLVATTNASVMEMRGRQMRGWLRVDADDLGGAELAAWVERGVAYARSLPAKR
jgi:hypothetical protein